MAKQQWLVSLNKWNVGFIKTLHLASRIVRVKYRRYLKMDMGSCNFKNSSSLHLKRARAKRKMIC